MWNSGNQERRAEGAMESGAAGCVVRCIMALMQYVKRAVSRCWTPRDGPRLLRGMRGARRSRRRCGGDGDPRRKRKTAAGGFAAVFALASEGRGRFDRRTTAE